LQILEESENFKRIKNTELIDLYIDVAKYRKEKFGDDDSLYTFNDKSEKTGAKK